MALMSTILILRSRSAELGADERSQGRARASRREQVPRPHDRRRLTESVGSCAFGVRVASNGYIVTASCGKSQRHERERRDAFGSRGSGARRRGTAVPTRRCGRCRTGSRDRKSTRLNSSHVAISYAVFCLKKKKNQTKKKKKKKKKKQQKKKKNK